MIILILDSNLFFLYFICERKAKLRCLHGYSCFILLFPKASVADDNTSVLTLEGITLSEVKLVNRFALWCFVFLTDCQTKFSIKLRVKFSVTKMSGCWTGTVYSLSIHNNILAYTLVNKLMRILLVILKSQMRLKNFID